MADLTFNTPSGQTVARKMLLLCLNTGSSTTPAWSPIGKRVEDSSMEFDWNKQSKKDILGETYTTYDEPIITQSFDPCELDSGDVAQVKLWNQAVKDHDTGAMANNDMLIVHLYAGTSGTAMFAERYASCAVEPTGLGGEGQVGMPIEVTFGGKRTLGTASKDSSTGAITFTASTAPQVPEDPEG